MDRLISVIIPNHNGSATIGKCLGALFSSRYMRYEVIVVDDCSEDDSVEIIRRYPCRLVRLNEHKGAAHARNIGAFHSRGDVLFFTDADCIVGEDTLAVAARTAAALGPDVIVGGTYTEKPHDKDFFSRFQSIFINYSETKRAESPDYIASHAMAVHAETFRQSGGFLDGFFPIIEDVEFSHRLRRMGCRLMVNPQIQVRHVFNFSLARSLRNAMRKSMYWTMYSAGNRDLFADSGTASWELKINVLSWLMTLVAWACWVFFDVSAFLAGLPVIIGANMFVSRGLIRSFLDAGGVGFAFLASGYFVLIYPLPVALGAAAGLVRFIALSRQAAWKGNIHLDTTQERPTSGAY